MSDLRAEHAERVARSEFANERRDQRELEFVVKRFKTPGAKHVVHVEDSPLALFSSSTAKPRYNNRK